jgi:tryptophan synthase alpha chain
MANRIDALFSDFRPRGRKAFVAFITAGDPTLARTPEIVWALEKGGADIVELGVPFSDPLADGTVNQLAADRALRAGATVPGVLDVVRTIRTKSQIPLVIYSYVNPLLQYGLDKFFADAVSAGADGLLALDLPPDERSAPYSAEFRRICLVAPTSPAARVEQIVKHASGFVYYLSREGVTGVQQSLNSSIEARVELLRSKTSLPICVGIGISNAEQARTVAKLADGVVVGSAIVDKIREWGTDADLGPKMTEFVRPIAEAIHEG